MSVLCFNHDFFHGAPHSFVVFGWGEVMCLGESALVRGTEPWDRSQQSLCDWWVKKKQVPIAQCSDSLQVSLLHTSSTFVVLITVLSPYSPEVLICGTSGKGAQEENISVPLLSVAENGCDWAKLLFHESVFLYFPFSFPLSI